LGIELCFLFRSVPRPLFFLHHAQAVLAVAITPSATAGILAEFFNRPVVLTSRAKHVIHTLPSVNYFANVKR
jgi:hypothetical protein